MSISIELIPRNNNELTSQIIEISKVLPQIDTLNIPDLLRFPTRSWEACQFGVPFFKQVIPHVRAIDFNLSSHFELIEYFKENNIGSVLVVTGDKPQDMSRKMYRNTSLELIRIIKKELPSLKVYAGIDPYRSSLTNEFDYVRDKIEAGVDGFFTQPFFDLRLLDIYMDHLDNVPVYWGICPVMSEKSKSYWESKNEVSFPKSFKLEYDSNIDLAKNIISRANERNSNAYFMPIRAEPIQYLKDVFS